MRSTTARISNIEKIVRFPMPGPVEKPGAWDGMTPAEQRETDRIRDRIKTVGANGITPDEMELAACLVGRLTGTRSVPCPVGLEG